MNKKFLLIFTFILLGIFSSYLIVNQITAKKITTSEPSEIVIGYIADMTTEGTGLGGISGRWALEIAVDEINSNGGILGKKVRAVILDDKADKELSKTSIENLIFGDKVLAVIGPGNSGNALYWLNIPQDNETIVICPIATASEIANRYKDRPKNYIFKLSVPTSEESRLLVPWILQKINNGKIAIIHDSSGYGVQGAKDFNEVLARWGKTTSFIKEYKVGAPAEELIPILESGKEIGAEALILYAYADSNAKVLKALEKVKGYNPVLVSGTASEVPTLWTAAGPLASKIVFPVEATIDLNEKVAELDKKIIAKYGKSPYTWNVAAGTYDAIQLLASAIKKAGTLDKRAVRDALENVVKVQGVIKLYDKPFSRENHEAITVKDLYLAHWVDGKVLKLDENVSTMEIK